MKNRIKRNLVVAILIGFICTIPINAFSNSSISVSQDSIIEEQEKKVENESQQPRGDNFLKGWTTTRVNVRKFPSTSAEVLDTLDFNSMILYLPIEYNKEWIKIQYMGDIAYIAKKYMSNRKCDYRQYDIPSNSGFKSYMSYTAITSKNSNQYKIQNNYAYTGNYGIRQADNRYCIALGSYFNAEIGQYIDLVLENGVVIPCILADAKANIHTDKNNLFTTANGCCSEFIIDSSKLNSNAKRDGNISSCCEGWNSPVISVRIYEENILK